MTDTEDRADVPVPAFTMPEIVEMDVTEALTPHRRTPLLAAVLDEYPVRENVSTNDY